MRNQMRAIHPGEILSKEFMEPLGLSGNALAKAIGVPANRVAAIVKGQRSVTASSALRLAKYFDTTPTFWLNLQQAYDLKIAEKAERRALRKIAPRNLAAAR